MELVIIAVLLTAGVAFFFLGTNSMPQLSTRQGARPVPPQAAVTARRPDRESPSAATDRELVDLMNEVLIVREELSRLKLALGAEPSTRGGESKPHRRRWRTVRTVSRQRRRP
jgi:hypothetical protein